jgi:hypothetical protein
MSDPDFVQVHFDVYDGVRIFSKVISTKTKDSSLRSRGPSPIQRRKEGRVDSGEAVRSEREAL